MTELYDQLLDPKTKLKGEEALLQAFATSAAQLRAWRQDCLADAEFEEGLWVDEADEAEVDRDYGAMAAKGGRKTLPATYRGGPWVLRLSLDAQGQAFAELLAGPGPARLPELEVELMPGQRSALEFPEAPDEIELVDPSGQSWTLG